MNISFIGFGNMAKAMSDGLMQNDENLISAASPSLSTKLYKNRVRTYSDNLAVLPNADVIILAVKPAQMKQVLNQIRPHLIANSLLISVASGLTLSWLEQHTPNTAIIRAMPNIAVAMKTGATPLFANRFVTEKQKQLTTRLFTTIGIATWALNENDMDVFTALSGSGPAYVFKFMEAMINTATTLGLPAEVAKTITLQTFSGALSLASESNLSINDLRKSVTSPSGTTAAALHVLEQRGFEKLIYDAMLAAFERAKQMGRLEQ